MVQRVNGDVLRLVLGDPSLTTTRVPIMEAYRVEWDCGCIATEHNQRGNVFFLTPCRGHVVDFEQVQQPS